MGAYKCPRYMLTLLGEIPIMDVSIKIMDSHLVIGIFPVPRGVVEITGQAALDAGITKGMIVDFNISAEVSAAIVAGLMDCYTIRCHNGGTLNCMELAWTVCATGGCPSMGWEG